MVAIQGQMLLLRHIYAECPGWSGHAAELTALRDGVASRMGVQLTPSSDWSSFTLSRVPMGIFRVMMSSRSRE
mgnify:CR=1 FL=1